MKTPCTPPRCHRRRHRSWGGVALLQARKSLTLQLDNPTKLLGVRCFPTSRYAVPDDRGQRRRRWHRRRQKIRRSKEKNYGYNALTAEYGDMRKAGVVDPVKVTRSALQNGARSPALLTTESLVADILPRKRDDHHDYHGEGGGMGGMGGMGCRDGWHGRYGGMGGMITSKPRDDCGVFGLSTIQGKP